MPSRGRQSTHLRIAADIGGTFTDVAVFNSRAKSLRLGKVLSTPDNLMEGIVGGVDKTEVGLDQAGLFLHGSTVAINAMLERTGARAALITTEGFRDIYEIGRVNRPDAYNLFFNKHEPLIERALRFEVRERMYAEGVVCTPLDEKGLRKLGRQLAKDGIEAIAVLFLHSYRNPAHEIRAREILEEVCPDTFITVSHELSQEYREFERSSTVAANAFIGPKVKGYVTAIEDRLNQEGFDGSFLVVQSTGGLYAAEQAKHHCVRMLESGPAAGVIGTQAIAAALGIENAISFDMGGTTAKAGVIYEGAALTTGSALIGGYERALPIQIAMMDIFEVGTGGGSIARVREDGALRVGPESSGAVPGPACYDLGGEAPTVTDANLVLGRLSADRFLGGDMKLNRKAADKALGRIAKPLGMSATAAADGMLRIANTSMSYAARAVTTERGLDAAMFTLFAYGGAGPLHAASVAAELGIETVIVPRNPGVFSAIGMLYADLRHDFVRTWPMPVKDLPFDQAEKLFAEMEGEGRDAIAAADLGIRRIIVSRAADMRYVGQEHAVTVDLPTRHFTRKNAPAIKQAFDQVHLRRYGTSAPEEAAQIVSLRITVAGILAKPPIEEIESGSATPPRAAITGRRKVHMGGKLVETRLIARDALRAGNKIKGPALIEESASTTVLRPQDRLEVDRFGNLVISIGGRR